MQDQPLEPMSPRQFAAINVIISTSAIGFLLWLVYFHETDGVASPTLLPTFNALFNSISAVLLVLGLRAIKSGKRILHQQLMLAALASSALFLINYIYYHYSSGDTLFAGEGPIRIVYFSILISHIVLSIVVFPMILTSVYLAVSNRLAQHKRFSKWTWGGWMYVSVTGVVVYLMLHVMTW
jgi:putative membrane protein